MNADTESLYGKTAETQEEIDVFIRLLNDYSSRLRDRSTELRRSIERSYYTVIIFTGMWVSLYAVLVFGILNLLQPGTSQALSLLNPGITIAVLVAASVLVLFFWGVRIVGRFGERRRILLTSEIKQSSAKLALVVRLASQALEHVERRRWKRLELELALTDAEGALDDAEQAMAYKFSLIPSRM